MNSHKTPIAMTIAGSDSGGGAGIQADLKAMSAIGTYGASVLTALTAQNTLGVTAIHDVPPDFITAQLDAVYDDLDVDATKIGMLSQPAVIEAVADGLVKYKVKNIVLDPVMVTTSGNLLLARDAVESLKSVLIPLAQVITPNLFEAAELLNCEVAQTRTDMERQASALLDMGAQSVLLKGGHFDEPTAEDLFVSKSQGRWYSAPRIQTDNTHGTGCTLSSAIAAYLAQGEHMTHAIDAAKVYLSQAIEKADLLQVGQGAGPVHHFFATWKR
ncbi:MAG: bifunctional hydroxymethylpyrimidine kinase/phosphomethylpyrimidine kinase [Hyphomicrobiales bacterium]